jgi:hypothetical protein
MNFEELKELVPYATGPKNHVLTMSPYDGITLALPGRHQYDTTPNGGDFVVMVTDPNVDWILHQFTHEDLFVDIDLKTCEDPPYAGRLMKQYARVVYSGEDPLSFKWDGVPPGWKAMTVDPVRFLCAVQCLALAEHRRYPQFESKGGGRYLPARFAAGIVYKYWTWEDARNVQRKGRPGVEMLEKFNGKPPSLKELAQCADGLSTTDTDWSPKTDGKLKLELSSLPLR